MIKTAIIYRTKYGATEQYAEWLCEALDGDLFQTQKTRITDLQPYGAIVLGGGIYAGSIAGFSFLRKHYAAIKDKKLAVFAVGAMPDEAGLVSDVRASHFGDEFENIPLFYCRGKWDESDLTIKDRWLVAMLKHAVAGRPGDAPAEPPLAQIIGDGGNWVDKKYILPIIDYVQGSGEKF